MADSPQILREFTQNLLTDLESGAITIHEAYAAASQYAYLRQELTSASLALSEAATISEEELTQVFSGVISETLVKLSELPSFQAQQPDEQASEQDIRDTARLQQSATARVREQVRTPSAKEKRRSFVHGLVNRFSSTMPTATDATVEGFVDRATAVASRENTPTQQADRFVQYLTDSIEGASPESLSAEQKNGIAAGVRSAAADQGAMLSEQFKETRREVEIYAALFAAPDIKRPDVFVDVMLNAPSTEPTKESLTRAEKLARVAQSLEESAGKQSGKLQFFSANGAKGIAGGLQKGADGILSLVGEPVRDMVLHEKVSGSLRTMLQNTQLFADRLGENFVKSALFVHINQDLTKQLSEKARGGQAGSIFGDVFSTVFRGPLGQPLARSTKESVLDYFELARANAAAPKGKAFLPLGVLPWNIYRTYESNRLRGGNRTFGGTRGVFPALGFSTVGSFFGDIFSSLVDKATSFTLLNPRLPGQLSASRRAAALPTRIFDDMPLFVALVVVVVLILLFVLPTPLNLNMLSHSSKVSALLDALKNNDESLGGSFPIGTIGETTLTCANISGAHKYQNDPSWSGVNCQNARPDVPACRPPTECTIGLSGCGSTSAAIILSAFGSNTNVPSVWNVQHQNNGYQYYPRSCASYWSGVINILRDASLSVFQVGISEIPSVLKDCGLLLAFVDEKWSSGSPTGHVIVITGISQEGGTIKVTTLDPMRPPGYVSTVTSNPTKSGDINIRGLFGVVK